MRGQDHAIWLGDVDSAADQIEYFLTGEKSLVHGDRILAALLVTRVLSTADGSGRTLQRRHLNERQDLFKEALPRIVVRHGGQARWMRSDRADAHFTGVARAAGCAVAIRETATALGLAVAQGIHVAEIDASPDKLSDHAFDVADRIATEAGRSEILMNRLASDLVSGSGLQFADRGVLAGSGSSGPLPLTSLSSERHLEPQHRAGGRPSNLGALTQREREVLALVADGLSNPHIAVNLGLSEHTVKRHVANILLKLDVPSRAAVAGLAAREGTP